MNNRMKKGVATIIGIILVLIGILCIFFIYNNENNNNNINTNTNTNTNTNSDDNTNTDIDANNNIDTNTDTNSIIDKDEVKVTFMDENKNIISVQSVKIGQKAASVNISPKEGYTFKGWYLDNDLFDFNTTITQNITLLATWEKNGLQNYQVRFKSAGGNTINDQTVNTGGKVIKPVDPVRNDNYIFVEWLLNGEPYNFETPVTKNIDLLATWVRIDNIKTIKLSSKTRVFSLLPSDQTNVMLKSSNTKIADVSIEKNYGYIIPKSYGTPTITVYSKDKVLKTITVKIVPDNGPIDLNNGKLSVYKKNLSFKNPRGSSEGFQDFDFVNINSTNQTFYFSMAYYGVLSNYTGHTLDNETDKMIRTSVICKTKKLTDDSLVNCQYMFVNDAGQGQTFIKEPSGEYFWTSSNSASKISGEGSSFQNNKYYCTNDKCTWWGGNNANISRYSFKTNNYGDVAKKLVDYNYGNINSKNIDVFVAADWKNNMIATITYDRKVRVYDKNKFISGKIKNIDDVLYSFTLPTDDLKTSKQGYGISNGYFYALRGNWNDGMYIEKFDMFGNRVGLKNITKMTGFAKYREELQGMTIINNVIYLGSVHRSNATCQLEKKLRDSNLGCTGNNIMANPVYNIYTFK